MSFWGNVAAGIVANILTVPILGTVLFVCYWWGGRLALKKFFGLADGGSLRIFVGHIQAKEAGPQGVVGVEEFSAAKNLESLFKTTVPGLSAVSNSLRFLQLADLDVEVMPAKRGDPTITLDQSVISLGSPASNQASFLIENELGSPVRFDSPAIKIPGLPPVASPNQAVIVKLCRDDRCFFYVFAAPEQGTSAAARYLFRNWRTLRKKYGDRSSFYCLVGTANNGGAVAQGELETPKKQNS